MFLGARYSYHILSRNKRLLGYIWWQVQVLALTMPVHKICIGKATLAECCQTGGSTSVCLHNTIGFWVNIFIGKNKLNALSLALGEHQFCRMSAAVRSNRTPIKRISVHVYLADNSEKTLLHICLQNGICTLSRNNKSLSMFNFHAPYNQIFFFCG